MDTLQIILSVVTASAAILALVISIIEIRKSNKQALFDRRLKSYIMVKWMKNLCDSNKDVAKSFLIEAKTKPLFSVSFLFDLMTNCSYLEEIQGTLQHTLDSESQRKYLLKMESLRNISEETLMIFPKALANSLSQFIMCYEEMLVFLYKYQIIIDNTSEECKKLMREFPNDNELENINRDKIINCISNTFNIANNISKNGTFDKLSKTIKL